jgi:hypothetical protein
VSTLAGRLLRGALEAAAAALRSGKKSTRPSRPYRPRHGLAYPGDFTGRAEITYSPEVDGGADPGEIVWTWVPYEEDPTRGKDRPVLIIGLDGEYFLGVMLSSKDHDRDARDEARWGRYWMDLGSGEWDPKGRPSEVRLDRIVRVDPQRMRREGAILDRSRFDSVAKSLVKIHGW